MFPRDFHIDMSPDDKLVTDLLRALTQGTRVSLFPFGPARISSTGLKWETEGMDFSPSGKIGTSNEALGGPIALLTSAPVILLVLPIAETVCLLDALSLSPTWLD